MKSLIFIAGRYLAWFIAGVTIFALCSGCERMNGSAVSEAMDDVKLNVLDPRGQPSGIFGRSGAAGAHILANRNPETQPTLSVDELIPLRMAPRLDSLENKTVYMVDTGFEGGMAFFEEMQEWFEKNMPSVKTVLHRKSGNAFVDSPELWPELKKKADGVVFGVGG
jgi:hypothetical protein